ncbi:hypothetical protein N836_24415 [Leptolyngbya sp. Heron Island J]|uniref:hypothetical protein n=1 Tax=Leptolyngbya sp. Heron Island J TaxID=1385935 RepID=UPI0003B9EA8F|nr:hypothetical protein [Leptolyngbya sp. Heron Island J]ESA32758.1 hypothetical protein N836_24415 [Leptolyngbya sp. Heron Island J]
MAIGFFDFQRLLNRQARVTDKVKQVPSEKVVSTTDFLGKNAAGDGSMELHSDERDVTSTDDVIAPNAITSPEDEYLNAELEQRLKLRKWVLLSLIGPMAVIPIWLMVLLSVPVFNEKADVSERMQIGYLAAVASDFFGLYYIVTRDLFPNSKRERKIRAKAKPKR